MVYLQIQLDYVLIQWNLLKQTSALCLSHTALAVIDAKGCDPFTALPLSVEGWVPVAGQIYRLHCSLAPISRTQPSGRPTAAVWGNCWFSQAKVARPRHNPSLFVCEIYLKAE